MTTKVAVVGAGFSGAYTARRLITSNFCDADEIEVYDNKYLHVACNTTSCAHGIDYKTLETAVKKAKLGTLDHYVLHFPEYLVFGETRIKNNRIVTFKKNLFIRDCLEGIKVINSEFNIEDISKYDLVIDATARRAVLGLNGTKWRPLFCSQIKVKSEEDAWNDMYFFPVKGFGYKWIFPLSRHLMHIGMGVLGKSFDYNQDFYSQIPNIVKIYRQYFERDAIKSGYQVVCKCYGLIRASSPKYSQPIVVGNVAAVGESAGMISSLTGGGCKEAIEGIEVLIDNLLDLERYERKLIKKFRWADKEFKIIDDFASGRRPSFKKLLKVYNNPKRVGIRLNLLQVYSIAKQFLVF